MHCDTTPLLLLCYNRGEQESGPVKEASQSAGGLELLTETLSGLLLLLLLDTLACIALSHHYL